MDPKMLQMMMLMGGGGLATQMAGMDMAPKVQGAPHVNPTNFMTGYEQRKAIRTAVNPQMHGGRVARMMSGLGGIPGMPQMGGGMDPSSMVDPSVANDALKPYGMQLPTHTNPFLFFQDQNQDGSPTWAGNHPKVAKAIEGAMIGATTPGGMTTGENISNVAKTVLGIPGLYRNSQAAQMQAPFDMAAQINGLQKDQADMETKLATAYHLYATGQAALDKPTKSYSGQAYQDANNRPYQINQVTGQAEPLDGGKEPLMFPGSTKVGTPAKPGQANAYPKGVSTVGEKAAWNEAMANGYQGDPRQSKDWNSRVMYWQGRNAAATGGAGTQGRKAAGQAMGDVSEADKTQLKALEDAAKEAEARAKEKPSTSLFVTNDPNNNPLAERNAEIKRRQEAAVAARKRYNDAASQVQAKQPNSKIQGGGSSSPKGMVFHPDGRIELPPPGQVK